jgi:uncharacterized membrane protein
MAKTSPSSLRWPGLLLGFSLGGFFDGILLHQVLQWHHLLSNVEAVQDLRTQVLFDGLFHVLMYLVAAVGLWQLWRARGAASQEGAGHRLWGAALLGFGAWHIVDATLSHWITGIHRIKVDSPNPLLWDLAWFFLFGVVPALLGWWMLRKASPRAGGGGRATAATLGCCALVAGPIAALPPTSDPTQVLVLFAPQVSSRHAFDALGKVDARVLWVDRTGGMWAVKLQDAADARRLYREGALFVSNAGFSLGCLSWIAADRRTAANPARIS